MKLRATYTSGIATQEFDTNLSPREFLEYQFGSTVAFENLGGTMEIVEDSPAAPAAEAPVKPKAKKGSPNV